MSVDCPICEEQVLALGQPSRARWVGPDGKAYCSMHFRRLFGFEERLVRWDGYVPPEGPKPVVPRVPIRARNRIRT